MAYIKLTRPKSAQKFHFKHSVSESEYIYLRHLDLLIQQDCIINICKLLDTNNNSYSLFMTFNKDTYPLLCKELKQLGQTNEFRNLRNLRDKVIAHYDKKRDVVTTIADIIYCYGACEEIFAKILAKEEYKFIVLNAPTERENSQAVKSIFNQYLN